jgi:ribosomal protein L11 methyltransferase
MSPQSHWLLRLSVQPELVFPTGERLTREEFFTWIWDEFSDSGLEGIHEGTVLSDEAHAAGFETESWVLDSGQAPHFRDWIGQQGVSSPELYFVDENSAQSALGILKLIQGCGVLALSRQDPQDWDAEWKRHFKGIDVPGFGKIQPPWEPAGATLILNPGAGFGTGTHETTQLCLQAMSQWRALGGRLDWVLDFGSGSGILAIGAALFGSLVHAVEIDPLAIENARENAKLNSVGERIQFSFDLEGLATSGHGSSLGYDLVFANILRPVLIQFCDAICSRVAPSGALVLSGLVEADLAEVIERYSAALGCRPKVMQKNEWRALCFFRTETQG